MEGGWGGSFCCKNLKFAGGGLSKSNKLGQGVREGSIFWSFYDNIIIENT